MITTCEYWRSDCTRPKYAKTYIGGCDSCHRMFSAELCEEHCRLPKVRCPCQNGFASVLSPVRVQAESYETLRAKYEKSGLIADKEKMVAAVTLPEGWTIEKAWADILPEPAKPSAETIAVWNNAGFQLEPDGSWKRPGKRKRQFDKISLVLLLMGATVALLITGIALDSLL